MDRLSVAFHRPRRGCIKGQLPHLSSVEPPLAAYDEARVEKQEECPICMEAKSCRVLQCKHEVCNDCWGKWRNRTSSIPVDPPTFEPQELEQAREARFQELSASIADDTRMEELTNNTLMTIFLKLQYGDEGLHQFWGELLEMPVDFFFFDAVVKLLREELDIPAMEILIRVLEERAAEINSRNSAVDEFARNLSMVFTNRIGELYEEVSNYRAAIPWYERALIDSKKYEEANPQHASLKQMVGSQHCNLGLAQKNAGFFSKAFENYNASYSILRNVGTIAANRKKLLREMEEWTGTSGKLTPGC